MNRLKSSSSAHVVVHEVEAHGPEWHVILCCTRAYLGGNHVRHGGIGCNIFEHGGFPSYLEAGCTIEHGVHPSGRDNDHVAVSLVYVNGTDGVKKMLVFGVVRVKADVLVGVKVKVDGRQPFLELQGRRLLVVGMHVGCGVMQQIPMG